MNRLSKGLEVRERGEVSVLKWRIISQRGLV